MFKIIIIVALLLYIIYYITIALQYFGLVKISNRDFTFIRCLIPFYFWIAPNEDKIQYIEIKPKVKDND